MLITQILIYMHEILVNDGTILNSHLKIIHQVAWMLHSTSGYDREDLFSEGCLQYLLRRQSFSDEHGTKLTTHIWNIVKNSLLDYLEKQPYLIHISSYEFMEELASNFLGTTCDSHRVREKFLCNAY